MTREQKLALILGFALVLLVGVLISDHLSDASRAGTADIADAGADAALPGYGRTPEYVLGAGVPVPVEPAVTLGRPSDAPIATHATPERRPRFLDDLGVSIAASADAVIGGLREAQHAPPAAQTERMDLTEQMDMGAEVSDETIARAREILERKQREAARRQAEQAARELARAVERERASSTGSAGATPPSRAPRMHRARRGESLWSIAERYYGDGSLHAALAEHNAGRIGDDGSIRAGATLLVPTMSVLTGGGPGAERRGAADPGVAAERYTVRAGDTLGDIAIETLGTSRRWREIAELNGIDDEAIRVGQVLEIPRR